MKAKTLSILIGTIFSPIFCLGQQNEGFEKLLNSVVRIDVWEADYKDGRKRLVQSQGSGVIMTNDGYILTNAHVATHNTEKARVTLANLERVDAEFVGWDHWTDLALLKLNEKNIEERGLTFSYAEFGNSNSLYLGETVFAVGTPYGLTRTVTRGVVSNNNRFFEPSKIDTEYEKGYFNNWLQTDAAINPGNSGGPLVRENGKVVGINTLILTGAQNVGFAVPSNLASLIMNKLITQGKVTRSYIGIQARALQELEDIYEKTKTTGLLIENVDPESPAQTAGLKPGDIILTMNSKNIDGRFPEQIPPIMNQIASLPIGSEIDFRLKREGKTLKIKVITEQLESRSGKKFAFKNWGMSVEELTRPIAREKKYNVQRGFIVIGLQDSFPAQKSGLTVGDLIVKANETSIQSIEALDKLHKEYTNSNKSLLLEVIRNHRIHYIVINP